MDHCRTKMRLLRINTHSLLSTNRTVKTQTSGTTDKEIINSFLARINMYSQWNLKSELLKIVTLSSFYLFFQLTSDEKVVCRSNNVNLLFFIGCCKVKNKVCRLVVGLKVLPLCSHLAVMHIQVCYGQTMFGYHFFLCQ